VKWLKPRAGNAFAHLRNLCFQVAQGEGGDAKWKDIAARIEALFGSRLELPEYVRERGEIVLSYRNRSNVRLDISSSGRGQQQTLLLVAHMVANPGAVLLLDEPDAHLEILGQRQIYQVLAEKAAETRSQIIAASHSEVILNEAADRDVVIAFVGRAHRIDDRGSQVLAALREPRSGVTSRRERGVMGPRHGRNSAVARTATSFCCHPRLREGDKKTVGALAAEEVSMP